MPTISTNVFNNHVRKYGFKYGSVLHICGHSLGTPHTPNTHTTITAKSALVLLLLVFLLP